MSDGWNPGIGRSEMTPVKRWAASSVSLRSSGLPGSHLIGNFAVLRSLQAWHSFKLHQDPEDLRLPVARDM